MLSLFNDSADNATNMLIAIEAERANIEQLTGVEYYAKQLILALAQIDRRNNYILYLRSAPKQWILDLPANFRCKVMPFPIFWTQIRISWEILWHPVDVLFIMASALPIIHPQNSVVTIHDLGWEFFPDTFGFWIAWYLRFSTWYACKFAAKIIAVSEQTKKDLLKKYALPETKVIVVYHGFDKDSEQEVSDSNEQQKINSLPAKFILYLGTLQPRKNILGLISAFIELKNEKQIPHSLVLVGGKGWLYRQIIEKISQQPDIIYLGYIKNRFAVLTKADLLVQPSFYEGFGMQILDAFAADVAVACSNVSSLPEVAGDAAIYFDPHNQSDIKKAISAVLSDRRLRSALIARGRKRLQLFQWKKTAEQTLLVLTTGAYV